MAAWCLFVILFVCHSGLASLTSESDCNNLLADIVLIMDGSGSVGSDGFLAMKNFLVTFVENIKSHVKPSSVRLAVIRYANLADEMFGLDDHPFATGVTTGINQIEYDGGGTNTSGALSLAKNILSSAGARSYATKLAVLLTDGQSQDTNATIKKAKELHELGIRIMTIGVGDVSRLELEGVASNPRYVYFLTDFNSLGESIRDRLVDIACEPVCSWNEDFCWPGNCSQQLSRNCVCRPGFTLEQGKAKRCQLTSGPELLTCRVTLKDSNGNEVRSRTSSTRQHCSNQQDAFMNIQPISVVYDVKAHLDLALGTFPYYVSRSKVGVVGINLNVTKISTAGRETMVDTVLLNRQPVCTSDTDSFHPTVSLDCNSIFSFSAPMLANGEQLCIDTEAQGGGFYKLQDYSSVSKGSRTFPLATTHKRICFIFDATRPQHCSELGSCTRSPLRLSNRLTRTPEIRVDVDQWMDPVPPGSSASQVSEYILEVHEVDVANSFLEVRPAALSTIHLNGRAPYDIEITLPPTQPRMYAILLEVHDVAGNVAYARRLVLYDNSSVVVLDPQHSLTVVSANPDVGRRWQSSAGDVCVDWRNRFYNDVFDHHDYTLPVKEDTGRGIRGQYDQITGLLPVTGTSSVRGVVKFEISWSVNEGSPSSWQRVPNVTAQSFCLPLMPQDGDTYDVTIRAYDIMNNTNTDAVRVSVDRTGPVTQELGLRGRWGRLGLHVHDSTDLSTMTLVVEASDPHSGLKSVLWSLGTQEGGDDIGRRAVMVQKLNNVTTWGTTPYCYCPVVGTCEIYRYDITFSHLTTSNSHTGDHHRDYFITVNLTNNAGLLTSTSVKVLIDASSPTRGRVLEGLSDSGEMDFTSESRVHVRWTGFSDHESGVSLYRVVLASRCLTDQEMDLADNATEVTVGTSTSFTFPSEGRYFTSVVAYNGALSPSSVACSDGVVFDTTPPRLLNVSIAHARAQRSVVCYLTSNTPWLVNSNMTRTQLANTTACRSLCAQPRATIVELDYLPVTNVFGEGIEESDELCRTLPFVADDLWIALPSDRLVVTWASEDEESEMEDFHVGAGSSQLSSSLPDLIPYTSTHANHFFHSHHSGLGHGTIFYLFLKATSKAGLQTQVVIGPVLLDTTPPVIVGTLTTAVNGDQLQVSWERGTIVDLEQPVDVPLVITYRVGHAGQFVTSFLPLSSSALDNCRQNNTSLAGCIQYPLSALRPHDAREPRDFFFQLHVKNLAGHITTVNSSSAPLPSQINRGLVLDVLPSAIEGEASAESDVWGDVDIILEPTRVCVAWCDLHLRLRHENIQIEVGIGTTNSSDDVIPFSPATSTQSDVTSGHVCRNVTNLPSYTRLYSVVKASNVDDTVFFSSDSFVTVPRNDPTNTLRVFAGRGCTGSDRIGSYTIPVSGSVSNFSNTLPLHPGDNLFVTFDPFVTGVQFQDAVVVLTTLTGYQIVLEHSTLYFTLTSPTTVNTSVRILSCQKQQGVLLQEAEEVVSTWEMQGPWTKLPMFLRAQVLDKTCLNETSSVQDTRRCLLAEKQVSPLFRSHTFRSLTLFSEHSYVTSVAVCFVDGCLPPLFSHDVFVTSRSPIMTIDDAAVLSQTSSELEVDVRASWVPSLPPLPCIFLWTISRTTDGSQPLSDWRVHTEGQSCSNIQIKEQFPFHGIGHGTLYVCVRPIHPWSASSPTCKILTRNPQTNVMQPFHVIELSQNTLRENDFQDYLQSQQLGSKLHELYDLDLDFAPSDLLLAALVTNGKGREVNWFVMNEARLPNGDSCAGDVDCVASAVSEDGTVVFSRQSTRLTHGTVYYVCARIWPRPSNTENGDLGEDIVPVEICGDGFVVDDERPVGETVVISNAHSGYLADGGSVVVTWEGFTDVETDVTALVDNTTLIFSVGLGSYPGGADLAPFIMAGQRKFTTFSNVRVSSGIFCYATVRARDRVGHVTEVTSDAVILDNTPPTQGRVVLGAFLHNEYHSGHSLHVTWEGITDPHSGILGQWVAVSVGDGLDDVIGFRKVDGRSTTINGSLELVDGHSYVVLLKSTNGAGLSTLTSSEPSVVDSSPPIEGCVWNGSPNEHVAYVTDIHEYRVHWSGFHDPHSGVAFYRVGLGTSPGHDDLVPFHHVGLRTAYTWRRQFDQGHQYFATVEACNHAGLCSHVSSSAVIFDNSPPTSGQVIVGLNGSPSGFYSHNTTLQAEWTGFADPQSGIREFWWCVGTRPTICDVKPFTTSLLTRAVTGAVTSLPLGAPLYLTVRAINFAGLITDGVSESFVVDVTPPIVVRPPQFTAGQKDHATGAQFDPSLLHLAWAFNDPDTPIATVTVSVRGHSHGRQAQQPITVGTDSHVTLTFDGEELLADGDVYRATVVGCNAAGLCTTVTSDPLLVDSTPPFVGKFLAQHTWSTENNNDSVFTTLNISWTGFTDGESGITKYHFTAGRTESDSDISSGTLVVLHQNSSAVQNLTLVFNGVLNAGDLVVLSVWAENALGLCSSFQRMTFEVELDSTTGNSGLLLLQRHSCSPHYCTGECTCVAEGQVCQTDEAYSCRELSLNSSMLTDFHASAFLGHDGKEIDFITSTACLEGFLVLTTQDTPSNNSLSILRFEYSFSLAKAAPGVGVMNLTSEPKWRDSGLRTSIVYCLQHPRVLRSGSSYEFHVRAWLSSDSYVAVTSKAVMADHTPPSRRRGRSVVESNSSCAADVDFVTQQSSVTSCWGDVFSDAQSGIAFYEVWVGSVPYGDDYQALTSVGNDTSLDIDITTMTEGIRYYVTVRAWNGAGLSTTVFSDGFVKDNTPPVAGSVFLASRHATDHMTDDVTTLPVAWHGFYDLHSGVTSYSVALFDAGDLVRPLVNFVDVGFETKHVFTGLSLQPGHSYKAAVKAFDAAGLESSVVFSPAIMVDVTPPEGVVCPHFRLVKEAVLSSIHTPIFRHETYNASLDVDVAEKNHLLKLVIAADSLSPGARVEIREGALRIPVLFRHHHSRATAEHVLLASTTGRTDIGLTVRGKAGANITAQLFSCSVPAVPSTQAVSLQQIALNTVCVSSTVLDGESGIMSLRVGLGTTPGGLQVLPLRSFGQGEHAVFEVSLQNGATVYATVLAQNHAESWSQFISEPVTMDTSPPVIASLNVSISYTRSADTSEVTSAVAVAEWTVHDAESGSVSCTCELEGHETSDDIQQTVYEVRKGQCRWSLVQPRHGARVRAVVTCVNWVQILATPRSADITVVVNKPDLSGASIHFLPNWRQFSPYETFSPGMCSAISDLEVTWAGAGGATVDHVQYRFLSDQTPLTEWSSLPAYKSAAMLRVGEFGSGNVTVEVRAVNTQGMTSETMSSLVRADDSPPTLTGQDATVSLVNSGVLLNWTNVFNVISDVTYSVYAGSDEDYGDVINHIVTKQTSYKRPCDLAFERVYIVIEAVYANGLSEMYRAAIGLE